MVWYIMREGDGMKWRHSPQFRMMLAYFTLAVAVIVFFRIMSSLDVIVGAIGAFFKMLSPFIWGAVIAYLLSIPCDGMESLFDRIRLGFIRRHKKAFSVALVYVAFVLLVYFTLRLLLPRIYSSILDFVSYFPTYYRQLEGFIESINENELFPFTLDLNAFFASLTFDNIMSEWKFENILSSLGAIFSGATYLFHGILMFISSVYFLFEAESIRRFTMRVLEAFVPAKPRGILMKYAKNVNMYFKKYIYCLIIDCTALAAVTTLEFTILGSRYALFLGLLLGVMNIIPYFGSIIASVVACVVIWLTQGFALGGISAIMLLITQQLDANVLQPRLFGGSMSISPLLVIISVTVGNAVAGMTGMIIAIPIATVFKNILDDVIGFREREMQPQPEDIYRRS
jgi:predicted PurR-regulated permease PerM